jgi:hypothetical protein
MSTLLRLKRSLNEVPLILEDSNGRESSYVIREMHGDTRDSYVGDHMKRVQHDKQGRVSGVKDYNGVQASLVSRCLYEAQLDVQPDGSVTVLSVSEKPQSMEWVQALPASTLTAVHEACSEINGLNKMMIDWSAELAKLLLDLDMNVDELGSDELLQQVRHRVTDLLRKSGEPKKS